MFGLIKAIIWLVGFVVISMFILDYFGYEVNRNYFKESKARCLKELKACQSEYLHQGIDNADCQFNCVDPKLILNTKKQESEPQTEDISKVSPAGEESADDSEQELTNDSDTQKNPDSATSQDTSEEAKADNDTE
jgi:hypothetical protein